MDKSQIRCWAGPWLQTMRKRAGLTQEQAAQRSGVSISVVRDVEQTGSPPDLVNFLPLVMAYRAEDALVNQIREWRAADGQAVGGNGDGGQGGGGATAGRRGPITDPPTRPAPKATGGRSQRGGKRRPA